MILKAGKIIFALTLGFVVAFGAHAALDPHAVSTHIQFVHYLDAGMPEQDVFIEGFSAHSDAPDPYFIGARGIFLPNLLRVEARTAPTASLLAMPVYAAASLVPHDPFKLGPHPLGPFYKGEALGFTLGQWLAARGSGSYTLSGTGAELTLGFEQLVPGGRYALWCGWLSAAADYAESEKPCGAADGSQNRFSADGQGTLDVNVRLKSLPASVPARRSMLLLSYERDSAGMDGEGGGYGLSSHVQLLYAFPSSTP